MTLHANKRVALLALALDDKPLTGESPALLEIDLWRRGKLNKKRSAEVKAYVARDSECYQQWLELLENEQLLAAEKQLAHVSLAQAISNWFAGLNNLMLGGGLVFATTAVLFAVITLKTTRQPDLLDLINADYAQFNGQPSAQYWYYQNSDKSFGFSLPTSYDRLKPAILYGLRTGLVQLQQHGQLASSKAWQYVVASYPSALPACPESHATDACQQQHKVLENFGRSLALMQLHCAQPELNVAADFYSKQQQRLADFKPPLSAYTALSPLTAQLNAWQNTSDKQQFCGQLQQLLNNIDN